MIEEGVHSYLSGGLGGVEVWPVMMPEDRDLPAVTYHVSSSRPAYVCEGPSNHDVDFQFDCWATTYAGVKALQNSLRDLLNGYTGMMGAYQVYMTEITSEIDGFEIKDRLYRVTIFTTIFYKGT